MASGFDRDALAGSATHDRDRRRLIISLGAVLGAAAAGTFGWIFLRGDEPSGTPVATTGSTTTTLGAAPAATSSTATTSGTPTPTTGETTVSTAPAQTSTTLATELSPIPDSELYAASGESRRRWIPEVDHGWIVDLETGSALRVDALPSGDVGGGVVLPDTRLVIAAGGRLWLGTSGDWTDITPAGSTDVRVLGSTAGPGHVHLYLGTAEGITNAWFRPGQPAAISVQWSLPASGVARVTSSHGRGLAVLESFDELGFPRYTLVGEATGIQREEVALPLTDPPESVVWGIVLLGGEAVYHVCESPAAFSDCDPRQAFAAVLGSPDAVPIRERFPGFSPEWAGPGDTPALAERFDETVLLTRTHLMLVDLQSGARTMLVRAADR
jgi:hypothetical protein